MGSFRVSPEHDQPISAYLAELTRVYGSPANGVVSHNGDISSTAGSGLQTNETAAEADARALAAATGKTPAPLSQITRLIESLPPRE